jgi:hypothetical protein
VSSSGGFGDWVGPVFLVRTPLLRAGVRHAAAAANQGGGNHAALPRHRAGETAVMGGTGWGLTCHTPVLGNRTEGSIRVPRMFKSHVRPTIW